MSAIIAPKGSPLNTAIIGVENLDQSIGFYRDLIGLSVSDPFDWRGKDFEDIWHFVDISRTFGGQLVISRTFGGQLDISRTFGGQLDISR